MFVVYINTTDSIWLLQDESCDRKVKLVLTGCDLYLRRRSASWLLHNWNRFVGENDWLLPPGCDAHCELRSKKKKKPKTAQPFDSASYTPAALYHDSHFANKKQSSRQGPMHLLVSPSYCAYSPLFKSMWQILQRQQGIIFAIFHILGASRGAQFPTFCCRIKTNACA